MNLYDILNIPNDASQDEIKQAYKKLVKQYHPDKNKNIDAEERFKEIQTAYEILSDKNKRMEYDGMSIAEKLELYDALQKYLNELAPNYVEAYKDFIKKFYGDEDELKNDVNELNLGNIYDRFFNNFYKKLEERTLNIDDIPIYNSIKSKDNIDLNIKTTIYTTFAEKYDNKFKEITVNRESNNTVSRYYIPLRETTWTFSGAGEVSPSGKIGDVIIDIKSEPHDNIKLVNNHDILINLDISLYEYLYGSKVNIELPNGNKFMFELPSCITRVPIFTVKNKGMPYIINSFNSKISITDNDNDKIKRGDLYLNFKIKDIDINKNVINKLFPPTVTQN